MSIMLFSKTFVGKINTIIKKFWWSGIQDDTLTSPIDFRSWEDICQPKKMEAYELETCILSIRVFSSMLLGTLLPITTLFLLLFSKLNTTTIVPSGLPIPWGRDTFSGRLFCRSKRIFAQDQSTNYMQVTAPFGPLLGVLCGTLSMTT
jgi:hypothetical protein